MSWMVEAGLWQQASRAFEDAIEAIDTFESTVRR